MENLILLTAVAGATEFLRRLKVGDYFSAATIAVATLIGGLAGAFEVYGVASVADGLIAGIAASGLVTVAGKIGGLGSSVNK